MARAVERMELLPLPESGRGEFKATDQELKVRHGFWGEIMEFN